jgi:hypothetical protein
VGGAAKDITFEASDPIEDSSGYVISDLPYLKEGIRVRCLWDHIDRLMPSLREKGLQEGIAVKVNYKDLTVAAYTTEWRITAKCFGHVLYLPG